MTVIGIYFNMQDDGDEDDDTSRAFNFRRPNDRVIYIPNEVYIHK